MKLALCCLALVAGLASASVDLDAPATTETAFEARGRGPSKLQRRLAEFTVGMSVMSMEQLLAQSLIVEGDVLMWDRTQPHEPGKTLPKPMPQLIRQSTTNITCN